MTQKNQVLIFKDQFAKTLKFQPNQSDDIVSETDLNVKASAIKTDELHLKYGSGDSYNVADILPELVWALDVNDLLSRSSVDDGSTATPNHLKTSIAFAERIRNIAAANPQNSGNIVSDVLAGINSELTSFKNDRTDVFRLYSTALLAIAIANLSEAGASQNQEFVQAKIMKKIVDAQVDHASYVKDLLVHYDQRDSDLDDLDDLDNLDDVLGWLTGNQLIDASQISKDSSAAINLTNTAGVQYSKANTNSLISAISQKASIVNQTVNIHYNAAKNYIEQMNETLDVEKNFYVARITDNWLTGTKSGVSAIADISKVFEKGKSLILDKAVDGTINNTARATSSQKIGTIGATDINISPSTTKITSLDDETVDNDYNSTVGVKLPSNKPDSLYMDDIKVMYDDVTSLIDSGNENYIDVSDSTSVGTTLANLSLKHKVGGTTPPNTLAVSNSNSHDIVHKCSDSTTTFANYDAAGGADTAVTRWNAGAASNDVKDLIETNNVTIKDRLEGAGGATGNNEVFDDMISQMSEMGWLSYIEL